ncbi:MAG: hypothetical protein HKN00_12550 [Flavobacteriaceae bacterium]|nr:hypothetical protein [Flavobacteriaceae bacterium]
MKTLINYLILLLSITVIKAQEAPIEIETKSVDIEDLISFVVRTYEAGDIEHHNISFIIQVNSEELPGEQLVMLKQGFKLISERLSDESRISILAYSQFNGIALQPTNAKNLELILHTLTDLKGNIVEFYQDGIGLGYEHAEENYNDEAFNSVVMIRAAKKAENEVVDIEKNGKKAKQKKKRDALMVTALALLPEIINLIKD